MHLTRLHATFLRHALSRASAFEKLNMHPHRHPHIVPIFQARMLQTSHCPQLCLSAFGLSPRTSVFLYHTLPALVSLGSSQTLQIMTVSVVASDCLSIYQCLSLSITLQHTFLHFPPPLPLSVSVSLSPSYFVFLFLLLPPSPLCLPSCLPGG